MFVPRALHRLCESQRTSQKSDGQEPARVDAPLDDPAFFAPSPLLAGCGATPHTPYQVRRGEDRGRIDRCLTACLSPKAAGGNRSGRHTSTTHLG